MFTREMLDGRCGEASGATCVRTRGRKCGELSDGRHQTVDSLGHLLAGVVKYQTVDIRR